MNKEISTLSRIIHFLLPLVFLFVSVFSLSIKAESATIETGLNYLRGDFGTGDNTTYFSTPVHIGSHPFKYLMTEITVPYIYQKGIDVITIGGGGRGPFSGGNGYKFGSLLRNPKESGKGTGHLFQNPQLSANEGNKGPPGDTNPPENGKRAETGPDGTENTKSVSENAHGIGDIYLYLSSDFHDFFTRFSRHIPTIDLSVGIKLPTADTEKGLGTGEYDYTLGLTFRWILGKVEYYLYGDYTWVGDMPDEAFEDVFCFGGGTEIDLSSIYTLMADLSGCTSLFKDGSTHYSSELGIKRKIFKNYFINGYGLIGFDGQSSDHGLGLSVGMDF
ncbi:MAG: hypothetical protein ACMUIU_07955 [bacterium]